MEELVDIRLIDPNPWQPREQEDPEHIERIARSIENRGLMQVPAGRRVGERVQLAFGHSRLAAFKLLANEGPGGAYQHMPVKIRELDDQEMFEEGISENIARKNLSPIEEAKAMQRYRGEFGKTSAEIGKLFGNLSDSAVRNKMRLLKLPEDIQRSLAFGEMPEGTGRMLIALYELPDELRLAAEDQEEHIKPSEILEAAKGGVAPKAIGEMVNQLINLLQPKEQPKPVQPPAPQPEPIPVPVQPVSKSVPEWVQPLKAEEEERHFDEETRAWAQQQEETVKEEVAQPTTGTPAPVQVPAPRLEPTVIEPVRKPEPAPEPEQPMTWQASTITVSLTYWPEDGNTGGRMVMAGVRVNQNAPRMLMLREAALLLPQEIDELLNEIKNEFVGGVA